jgi:glycosyltransferase involved in cell wall biosynthesis
LVDSGIVLAHFHGGGIYEWQSHKAWQSPLFHLGRAGIPCLITSHLNPPLLEGFTRPDRPSWQKALLLPKAWLSKAAILRRAIIEIFVSKHDCLQARRFYPPFAGKFRQLYHSTLNRNISGLPQEERKKTVFCLGTFCERKAQTILVRAFALVASRHPDWNLHLMGLAEKSAYLDLVHEAIARSGLSDRIQISPAQNNPGPFLASAAVFAMPSLLEGLPLSLQEALYYECACVGSDTGGFLELIENEETGLLVPPGDEKALAAALDRLMSDPKLRLRLGRRARQSIIEKGMLAELMVDQHVRIYEKILAGGKA